MPPSAGEVSSKIRGKDVFIVRDALGMNQIRFAKWLSHETGEKIDSKAVARMEAFGKTGACSPKKPSSVVTEAILKKKSL